MDFLPDENNLFSPPRSVIGSRVSEADFETDTNAEATRLYHLSHESAIKSVGLLGYLGALFGVFITFSVALVAAGVINRNAPAGRTPPEMVGMTMWFAMAFRAICSAIIFGLGFGLRRLQAWARWTAMVLLVLSMLYFLLAGLILALMFPGPNLLPILLVLLGAITIQAYIFFLLVIPKSGMVFSAEYRLVIQKTPWIICKSSTLVKILIGLVVGFMLLAFIGTLGRAFQ